MTLEERFLAKIIPEPKLEDETLRTFVIAEAGTNHCDDDRKKRLQKARCLASVAKRLGADAVKFQAFFPDEELFCPMPGDENRWARWEKTFLYETQWEELDNYCREEGVDLLLSVFQPRGVELLKKIQPRYIKVASRAAKTFPYDDLEGPFLISTGMGLPPLAGPPDHASVSWLQCSSVYPAPMERWTKYRGLSDHSGVVWPGLDAIARGAQFLEVHFRPDGDYGYNFDCGPDKAVCLNEENMVTLTRFRNACKIMRDQ